MDKCCTPDWVDKTQQPIILEMIAAKERGILPSSLISSEGRVDYSRMTKDEVKGKQLLSF
jgi:hypothetical protein